MQKFKALLLLWCLFFSFFSTFAAPAQVEAAGRCGTDFYNGRFTGCYVINVGGEVVPESGWDCGPARQCYMFEEHKGQCGVDPYMDGGTRRSTYCSVSNFGRSEALGYTGCNSGDFCIVGPPVGNPDTCNWGVNNDGRVWFCAGGFGNANELHASRVEFQCINNCGGNGAFSSTPQVIPLSGAVIGDSDMGKYTCYEMDFDSSVRSAIQWKIDSAKAGCTVAAIGAIAVGSVATAGLLTGGLATIGAAGGLVTSVTTIGQGAYVAGQVGIGAAQAATALAVDVGVAGGGTSDICTRIFANYEPHIQATVFNQDGNVQCRKFADVVLNVENGVLDFDTPDPSNRPYQLCTQIKDGTQQRADCEACSGTPNRPKDGIWTAVGCIKTDANSIVQQAVQIGLGLAGGIALLMIVAAGFLFSTSQNDPKRVQEARDLLTSAVVGLLFIFFSVTILQFIGVKILQIPGFGS